MLNNSILLSTLMNRFKVITTNNNMKMQKHDRTDDRLNVQLFEILRMYSE